MEAFLIAIVGGSIAIAALAIAFAWVYVVLDGLFGPLRLPTWLKSLRKVNPHDHPKPPPPPADKYKSGPILTKDCKPLPKDISEPVIKILDLMKDEPGRFSIKSETHGEGRVGAYVITDRSSGVSVRPAQYYLYYYRAHRHHRSDAWLTDDEVLALYQSADKIHTSRTEAWNKARNKAQRDWFKQQLDKGSN